ETGPWRRRWRAAAWANVMLDHRAVEFPGDLKAAPQETAMSRPLAVVIGLVGLCGFVFCFGAYYPGFVNPDSLHMYIEARTLNFDDWQSAMLPLLWAPLNAVVEGSLGMLALLLAMYWGAFVTLACAAVAIHPLAGVAMIVLGFMPFTIIFSGVLITDTLL